MTASRWRRDGTGGRVLDRRWHLHGSPIGFVVWDLLADEQAAGPFLTRQDATDAALLLASRQQPMVDPCGQQRLF